MRISEDRRQKLYDAIHSQIMELRVEIKMAVNENKPISAEGLDHLLFCLTDTIWNRQKFILNI